MLKSQCRNIKIMWQSRKTYLHKNDSSHATRPQWNWLRKISRERSGKNDYKWVYTSQRRQGYSLRTRAIHKIKSVQDIKIEFNKDIKLVKKSHTEIMPEMKAISKQDFWVRWWMRSHAGACAAYHSQQLKELKYVIILSVTFSSSPSVYLIETPTKLKHHGTDRISPLVTWTYCCDYNQCSHHHRVDILFHAKQTKQTLPGYPQKWCW